MNEDVGCVSSLAIIEIVQSVLKKIQQYQELLQEVEGNSQAQAQDSQEIQPISLASSPQLDNSSTIIV